MATSQHMSQNIPSWTVPLLRHSTQLSSDHLTFVAAVPLVWRCLLGRHPSGPAIIEVCAKPKSRQGVRSAGSGDRKKKWDANLELGTRTQSPCQQASVLWMRGEIQQREKLKFCCKHWLLTRHLLQLFPLEDQRQTIGKCAFLSLGKMIFLKMLCGTWDNTCQQSCPSNMRVVKPAFVEKQEGLMEGEIHHGDSQICTSMTLLSIGPQLSHSALLNTPIA